MDLSEVIKKRRSIRQYKADPIDEKTLNEVLEAGRLAPSWGNSQTWRFVVVTDEGIKTQLADTALRPTNRGIAALKQAPAVIAVCAELGRAGWRDEKPSTNKEGYWFMFDAGLALENMALTAASLGLGTLFIGGMNAEKAEAILGVPEGYAFVILMVIGHPDEQPEPRPRKDISEIVFKDRFGNKR